MDFKNEFSYFILFSEKIHMHIFIYNHSDNKIYEFGISNCRSTIIPTSSTFPIHSLLFQLNPGAFLHYIFRFRPSVLALTI